MAEGKLGIIHGAKRIEATEGIWSFDDDDWALYAMLCDPVYCAELLFQDPTNRDYHGCYHVIDYQYPLFRVAPPESPYEGRPCARSVGKTESMKAQAVSHTFKRVGDDMLITAPELIHLMPLCDAIEERIIDTRLTREFLDTRGNKTGITHKPFQVDFLDNTKLIGRIPKVTGTGVKGQHVTDLRVEEAQDYPEKGWIEVHETVMKDRRRLDGKPDFSYVFMGVHTGVRDGKFYELSSKGEFIIKTITAIMRPGWGPDEKAKASAMYGGTHTPDYRRNILGEASGASSAFFVTARLMACIDQNRESQYNTEIFKWQKLSAEEVDAIVGEGKRGKERSDREYEILGTLLDIPEPNGNERFLGMDVGLVNDPTVIMLFEKASVNKRTRLRLIRMYHLWRFREQAIRFVTYHLGWRLATSMQAFGQDITGLGLPMFQAMEDDESEKCPQNLRDVSRGYVFNAKVPVAVDKANVVKDHAGKLRDHLGTIVEEEKLPTGEVRYIARMSMIEASTRYLRKYVDGEVLQLPFVPEIASDFQGETVQRVRAMAGVRRKPPGAFHILDAARAFAMAHESEEIEAKMAVAAAEPVFARAMDMRPSGLGV